MSETTEIILDIKVQYEEAFKQIGKLRTEQDLLKASEQKLKDEVKSGEITRTEYNQSLAASKAQYQANSAAIKLLEQEVQNSIASENAQIATINNLSAKVRDLTTSYTQLSQEQQDGSKGQAMLAQLDATRTKLAEARQEYDQNRTAIGTYKDTTKNLTAELESYVTQLEKMNFKGQESSIEYQNMAQEAGKLKNAINDANQTVATLGSDTLALDALKEGVQTLIDSFTIYQSACTIAGVESETVAGIMEKLQATMAALNAATAIYNTLSKQSALMQGIITLQTKAHTAAQALGTKGTVAATAAQKVFNFIANMNPYILLATVLIAVIAALVAFASSTDKAADKQKKLNDEENKHLDLLEANSKKLKDTADEGIDKIEKELELMKARGDKTEDIIAKERELLQARIDSAAQQMEENKEQVAMLDENKKLLEEKQKALLDGNNLSKGQIEALEGQVKTLERQVTLAQNLKKEFADTTQSLKVFDAKLQNPETKKTDTGAKTGGKTGADPKKEKLDTEKQIQDLTIALMQEGKEKEKAILDQKLKEELAKIKGNGEEKAKLRDLLDKKHKQDEAALEEKYSKEKEQKLIEDAQKQLDIEQKNIENRLAAVKEGSQAEHDLKIEQLNAQHAAELAEAEKLHIDKAEVDAKYQKLTEEQTKKFNADIKAKALSEAQLDWQNKITQAKLNNESSLQLELEAKQAEYASLTRLENETDAQFLARQLAVEQQVKDSQDNIYQNQVENQQKTFRAMQAIGGAFTDLFNAIGEDNETMAAFTKTLALFNIGVNTAEAISKATASAKGFTAVDYAIQIATGVAAVTANIVKAKQLLSKEKQPKAPKFATGGLVTGSGSGTSDSIMAHLSSGESVITAQSTGMFSPIISALNQIGGGAPIAATHTTNQIAGEDMLAKAFAKAVNAMPNPIVSVEEIHRTENRVRVLETAKTI